MVRSTEGEYAEFAFTLPSAKPERGVSRRVRDVEKDHGESLSAQESRKQEEVPSLPEKGDHPDSGVC